MAGSNSPGSEMLYVRCHYDDTASLPVAVSKVFSIGIEQCQVSSIDVNGGIVLTLVLKYCVC